MANIWQAMCLLAQDAAAAPDGPAVPPDGGNAGGGGVTNLLFSVPWLPFVMIAVMFYFMLIRPEKRKRNEQSRMLDALKVNDRIVTIGGIHGVVVNIGKNNDEVSIRVDENTNTKMKILRSAISRVLTVESEDSKDSI